jgi:ABC-2 type transport system ATP-binding protein
MAQTADHIIVLGRGRIIADAPVADIVAKSTGTAVTVRTPDAARLTTLVASPEVTVTATDPTLLIVNGLTAPQIGELAAREGIVLHELTPTVGSLEDAYMQLTADDVEYRTSATAQNPEVAR